MKFVDDDDDDDELQVGTTSSKQFHSVQWKTLRCEEDKWKVIGTTQDFTVYRNCG